MYGEIKCYKYTYNTPSSENTVMFIKRIQVVEESPLWMGPYTSQFLTLLNT